MTPSRQAAQDTSSYVGDDKKKTDTIIHDDKSGCCSCEDCTQPKTCLYYNKRKNKPPAKHADTQTSGAYGLMIETLTRQETAVEEQKNAYLTQSKGSSFTAGSKTRGSDKKSKPPVIQTGTQPSGIYGVMIETLSRQKSAVKEQKTAYLTQSKGSSSTAGSKIGGSGKKSKPPAKQTGTQPPDVYGLMIETLSRQESAVEEQKTAYLTQIKGSSSTAVSKIGGSGKKSKPPAKQTGTQPPGVYGLMIETLSRQESAVEEQKTAYLTQIKGSSSTAVSKTGRSDKKSKPPAKQTGTQPSCVYGLMIETLSRQESAVEQQKFAYLPQDNYCVFVVTKRTSKSTVSDNYDATTPSSSGFCLTEILKSVIEYKSPYSMQNKCSNCTCNDTISSESSKSMTRSKTGPRTSHCPSKSKSGAKNKQVFNVNRLDTKNITFKTKPTSYKNCSECSKLEERKCELPNYSAESKRYKPTKNAQEVCRNILQTQAYQNKYDECDTYTNNIVSESPGYVFELPKYTHNLTLQNDCQSIKSSTNNSKLWEAELQDYFTTPNTREPVINTGEININRREAKWIADNSLVLNKYCHDDDSAQNISETRGYVVELPIVKEKRKCYCNYSAKCSSDKPERDFKQQNHTANDLPNSKETNKTEEICNTNCNRHKHATETPTEKRSGCQKCTKCASTEFVANVQPKYTENPPSQKKCCVCRKSDKNYLASPNAQELPHRCDATQKTCEYPVSENECCKCRGSEHYVCKMKSIEVPGYVFEIPKHTRNNCNCNKLRKNSIQSNTENICKNMVGTTIETVKALKSIKSPHVTNVYTILCNNILKKQAATIEGLKKIYLPQKKFELPTKTCCTPLPNLAEPSDGETEILSAGDCNECLACKLTKPYKYSFKTNILQTQADYNGRLKKKKMPEKNNLVKFELQTDTYRTPSDGGIEILIAKEFGGSMESNASSKTKKISKCDLLKRLRDVYKACSCKICECKPTNTDAPECRIPCENEECLSPLSSYEMNQWQICGCKPCDCVQCIKTMNIDHSQTLVVAPVEREDNVSRLECNCSPCRCLDCGIRFDSHVVNEMSTSINRHALCKCEVCPNERCDRNGLDSCTCDKHKKIISKPVELDTHDFDIRSTKVAYDKPMFGQMKNEKREYVKAINDLHDFHLTRKMFDGNISKRNTAGRTLPTHDQIHTWKNHKETSHSDLVNSAKLLNVNDYKRIRNTLKKAKEFSLELISLLNKYEKANSEFESISETLKLSQESLSCPHLLKKFSAKKTIL